MSKTPARSWMTALLGKSGRGRTVAATPRSSHPFLVPMSCTVGAQQKRGSGGKELLYWQALFLISTALKSYAIPFCFLGTVIVNEKQYCNISSYNQILIPQDSLKRKKCIYGCEKLLISAVTTAHGSTAAARWAFSLPHLSREAPPRDSAD